MNEIDFIMLLSANVPLEGIHENYETVKICLIFVCCELWMYVRKYLTIFSIFFSRMCLIMIDFEGIL